MDLAGAGIESKRLFMLNFTKRITVKQLTSELGFKDYRKTIKWLKERDIPFKNDGRGYYVLMWHIEFSSSLEVAKDLQELFPQKWEQMLGSMIPDARLLQAVLEVIPSENSIAPTARAKGKIFFK